MGLPNRTQNKTSKKVEQKSPHSSDEGGAILSRPKAVFLLIVSGALPSVELR